MEAGSKGLDCWVAILCIALWNGDWSDVNEKLQVKALKRGATKKNMELSLN